jgi:hypothetical protein
LKFGPVESAVDPAYDRIMPKGPQGQKRPADVVANAVKVMRIATGEEEETPDTRNPAAVALSKLGASKGGQARAAALGSRKRRAIAKKAANVRWGKSHKD